MREQKVENLGKKLSDKNDPKRRILMNVIVPKLSIEYARDVWEGNVKFVKQFNTIWMTTTKKKRRWYSTTSNTVLRAELGICPLKTNRDKRKLK